MAEITIRSPARSLSGRSGQIQRQALHSFGAIGVHALVVDLDLDGVEKTSGETGPNDQAGQATTSSSMESATVLTNSSDTLIP